MNHGQVYVGTAGFSIPREHAASFPEGPSHLWRCSRVFGAVEINSTFWRRHRPATFARWHDTVPPSFRFAVKVPKAITHDAELAAPTGPLRQFLGDLEPLGAKLGPLLVQLPASVSFDRRRVNAFFRALTRLHSGPVACEPRHPSWYTPAATEVLCAHRVSRVVADPPRPDDAWLPGGDPRLLYLRLHGSPRRYYSSYDEARLAEYLAQLLAREPGSSAFCIFDNTASGAAAGNAARMLELLRFTAIEG